MGLAYLFEFFNVDVELRPQFSFSVREGRDLVSKGAAAGGFGVGASTLDFVFGAEMGDFGVLVAKNGFKLEFAEFGLVG